MSAQVIDGKKTAMELRRKLAEEIAATGAHPRLVVFFIGDNPASEVYVRNKEKAAAEAGIDCEVVRLPASVSMQTLQALLLEKNADPEINGILVQLPLPEHLDPLKVLAMIDAEKDVDGFSPVNAGLLQMDDSNAVIAATPRGVLALLQQTGINLKGLHAVIIGRSNIVGRPLADLLLNQDCTVTVIHSKTPRPEEICRQADIIVAACGCPKLVKADWVKEGAAVIDVGINRVGGKLCGDVDFESVRTKAAYLSPVPGGVGPMTIAMLLDNTYRAYLKQKASS